MHRTQIYLHDALHDSLKRRAQIDGISMSELIRRTLEQDIKNDPLLNARTFFERLEPLQSFAQTTAESYVRGLRGRSRLLREGGQP